MFVNIYQSIIIWNWVGFGHSARWWWPGHKESANSHELQAKLQMLRTVSWCVFCGSDSKVLLKQRTLENGGFNRLWSDQMVSISWVSTFWVSTWDRHLGCIVRFRIWFSCQIANHPISRKQLQQQELANQSQAPRQWLSILHSLPKLFTLILRKMCESWWKFSWDEI